LVSVLFNEPKLLKSFEDAFRLANALQGFSALQRAEIAEIKRCGNGRQMPNRRFSALQRAEIAEM